MTPEDRPLTIEEQAANFETYQHLEVVMKLLAVMQWEITRRMFTHDRSKLRPPEVEAFTQNTTANLYNVTYGSPEYFRNLENMKEALAHHYAHNRHHTAFFENGIEGMNLIDLLEMICDWLASSKKHRDGDIWRSLEINTSRLNLSPQLVAILSNTIHLLDQPDPFANLQTQKDL